MAKEKKQNNIVRNMMIALVGGLVVGLGFMLLKQQMSEGTWNVINALLFQGDYEKISVNRILL